jgi:dinuclear metal center YbgI/SA1388 family protein
MATTLAELLAHCNDILQPQRFKDYCPNGLQVEGRERVARLVTGVTASQRLLDAAIAWEADAILVHHGYFWQGEAAPVVGMKRRRLATLLAHDVSLLAYHLPLDAHPELGNNATWGQQLGLTGAPVDGAGSDGLLFAADLASALSLEQLMQRVAKVTAREPLLVGEALQPVSKVVWCTGAAQSYIEQAVACGAQVFISGEISEQTVHIAREAGIAYIAAGHHATERYGVQALGAELAQALTIEHRFIDIDNPV